MVDKRTRNLKVENNGEVLELGYFSLKFQQWMNRLWKTPSAYTVFVSQAASAAPTVSILNNTLGDVVWARTATGTYTVTSDGAFIEDKTTPNKDTYTDIDGNYITVEWVDVNTLSLKTYGVADTDVLADSVLDTQLFNVEVYNN